MQEQNLGKDRGSALLIDTHFTVHLRATRNLSRLSTPPRFVFHFVYFLSPSSSLKKMLSRAWKPTPFPFKAFVSVHSVSHPSFSSMTNLHSSVRIEFHVRCCSSFLSSKRCSLAGVVEFGHQELCPSPSVFCGGRERSGV